MSIKYCPSCANKMEYDVIIPKKCNKCGINFADAFRQKISTAKKSEIIEEDDDYELVRVKKNKFKTKQAEAIRTTQEMEAEDFSDDNVDDIEKNSMLREIRGSIDESDFIVNFGGETIEKLGQYLPKPESK